MNSDLTCTCISNVIPPQMKILNMVTLHSNAPNMLQDILSQILTLYNQMPCNKIKCIRMCYGCIPYTMYLVHLTCFQKVAIILTENQVMRLIMFSYGRFMVIGAVIPKI